MLIYSFMMVSVETKTFEMGIYRMIGTSRVRVVQLLLFQSMFFALPSLLFGLIAAQVYASPCVPTAVSLSLPVPYM
jgi:ABC-type antimicrobial peptide transport system permease subunit